MDRRTRILLGTLAVVALGAGVWCYNYDLFAAARDLPNQQALAQKEGLVLDLAKFGSPPVADDQNAALVYKQAVLDMQTIYNEPYREIASLKGKPLAAQTGAPIKAALRKIQPQFEKLHRASELSGCDWDRDWTQGDKLVFSEYAPFRLIGAAMRLDALNRMEAGDYAGAIRAGDTLARMSRHMGIEPSVISTLIQAAFQADAFSTFSELLERRGRDPQVRRAVRDAVQLMGPPTSIRHTLLLELPVALDQIRGLEKDPLRMTPSEKTPPKFTSLAKYKVARDAYSARVIEYYRNIFNALPKDPADYLEAQKTIERVVESFHGEEAKQEGGKEHTHPLKGISYAAVEYLRPIFGGGSLALARGETQKRLLLEAVDVLEGKNPQGVDPFSDERKPFLRKGNRIYSIGFNGKDDGGSDAQVAQELIGQTEDIVVKLPK